MTNISLEDLLKAGAHFGHRVSRWNPKMSPYIFAVRNRFHIFDLEKTNQKIQEAQNYVRDLVRGGGTILFVGTKKQAREIVKKYAQAAGMPFVVTRWLGGTLTNFKTIQRSIKKLAKLEELVNSPDIGNYTKKERLMKQRELAKNSILFEGLRDMKKIPEAIFVVSADADKIAAKEASDCKLKIIGVVDSNADPTKVDFPIPANDDAIKSLELITQSIAQAVLDARGGQADSETAKN